MIISKVLNHIFMNTTNLAVLRVLNKRVIGLSGRETARLAGISLRATKLSLNSLVYFFIESKERIFNQTVVSDHQLNSI